MAYLVGTRFLKTLLVSAWIGSATSISALSECLPEPAYRDDEPKALALAKGKASRDGETLRLMTDAGPVVFTDTDCEDGPPGECAKYALAAALSEHGLWVVHVGYYEGGIYKLVNMKTGKVDDINGFPWFSPDRSRLAAITNDPHSGIYALLIWKMSPEGPRKEWKYDHGSEIAGGYDWSYCIQRWESSTRVALEGEGTTEVGDIKNRAWLIFDGRTWRYKRQKPKLKH